MQALGLRVRLEGYAPPDDPRLGRFAVTPDPGVIEVNIHPAADWEELKDHVETLYEVDLLYGDRARARGISNFRRIDSLNDFPPFLDALADLVEPRLA